MRADMMSISDHFTGVHSLMLDLMLARPAHPAYPEIEGLMFEA